MSAREIAASAAAVETAPGLGEAGARSAPARRSPGLVNTETSHAYQRLEIVGPRKWDIFRNLAKQRRLSRMKRSICAFAQVAREGMELEGRRVDLVMVTLTYAPNQAYEPRHISSFVQRSVEWLDRRGYSYAYAWVMEMQRRGAPHYHILFWLPVGVRLPKPDSISGRQRTPLWPHGSSRIELARSPGYIVKYTTKGDGNPMPFRARLFGIGASEKQMRCVARWRVSPKWLRELSVEGDRFSRVSVKVDGLSSSFWLNRSTGEMHKSPWRFSCEERDGLWHIVFECGHPPEKSGSSEGMVCEEC